MDCNCDMKEKTPFVQTKTFLGIVTVFAALMLAFPTYAHIFISKTESRTIITKQENIQTAEFTISGMSCSGCEAHVSHEVNKLTGIISTTVSYKTRNAIVVFDQTKTDIQGIEQAIAKTGYSVTDKKEVK